MFLCWLVVAINTFGTLGSQYASPGLSLPVSPSMITSSFGPRVHPISGRKSFHSGVDLSGKEGAVIHAIGRGQVIYAGPYLGYGELIVIRHGLHLTSHYAHCAKISVKVGQFVKAGTGIGAIGHTGRATGPHLHFEIRLQGKAVNPVLLLPQLKFGGTKNGQQ